MNIAGLIIQFEPEIQIDIVDNVVAGMVMCCPFMPAGIHPHCVAIISPATLPMRLLV